ncbi:MAG: FtsX-like permease family protein [Cyclobacteriaceae bacterium]|jgi:ABC-type lipoprotein release transport system permease subunit|nr:FtsX-like permease family protein [Cyclobacteriaceae bacterium]
MWLLKLAWKNLWRNRSRTLITLSAIFFAVILSATTNSLQDGVFDHFIRNMVSFYSGYIQVHKDGYWDQQVLDNGFERRASLEESITNHSGVISVAPRIESYALASAEDITKGCMVVGIDPKTENAITFLSDKIVQGTYFSDNEVQKVALLSEGLANRLNLNLNDTVILISQGYHGAMAAGKYRVSGIVHFGSPQLNDQLLYLPITVAQEFYSAENLLTSYVLSMNSDKNLKSTAQELQTTLGKEYEVMTWMEMLPEVEQHIKTDKGSMYIISGVLYLLIGFGIFGTFLMMMAERRFELGMLIAIGMKKHKIVMVLLVESVLYVLVGCLVGICISIPITWYLKVNPIRFGGDMAEIYLQYGFEPIFPASTDVWIFITQGIIVLVMGLALSLYPMMKVWRMDPVTAMKK